MCTKIEGSLDFVKVSSSLSLGNKESRLYSRGTHRSFESETEEIEPVVEVGDFRFLHREGESERIREEPFEFSPELFRLFPVSIRQDDEVVGISHIDEVGQPVPPSCGLVRWGQFRVSLHVLVKFMQ